MPRDFQFLDTGAQMFFPLQFNRAELMHGQFTFDFVARLKPGVTLAQANGDVARMIPEWLRSLARAAAASIAQIFESARITPALRPLKDDVVGDIGPMLWILMATIGIVLLIACANVSISS